MRWLSANWIWIVVIGGMLWMHFGMHRNHSLGGNQRHAGPGVRDAGRSADGHVGHDSAPTSTDGEHRHRGC